MCKQGVLPLRPEARHLVEQRLAQLTGAKLGVEVVGEAVSFVADAHEQGQADVVAREL